jgi:predicted PurR-regulated permease PerM
VVVILQDHSPSRPDRARHLPYHSQRIAHMLEHETRVSEVEMPPFAVAQRRRGGVALPKLQQVFLAVLRRLERTLRQLLRAALDGKKPHARCTGHPARKLSQPAAEIDDALPALHRDLAQRIVVHQTVQQRKPALFFGGCAVQVLLNHGAGSNAIPYRLLRGYILTVQTEVNDSSRTLERAAIRRNPRAGKITLGVLAVLASGLFLWVVLPFWSPLLLAAVLAAVFQWPLDRLTGAFRGRRRSAGAVISVGVLVVIVLPFASVAAFGAREAISGFSYVRDTLGVQSVSDLKTVELPAPVEKALAAAHLTRAQVRDFAGKAADRAQEIGPELLASSGRAIFHTALMLLAFYFLLVDGRRLIEWLWNVSPLEAKQTEELLKEFHSVATGSIIGNVASAVLQGVLAGIGFAIFSIPHAAFFGLLVGMASFVPVIGTALVWVPAVLLLLLNGHTGGAIGLAIWCSVGVVGVEHLAKPFILRATSGGEMHTGLMFLALLGGLEVFGILGVILGPLIVSFFISLMRMIERDARAAALR